MSFESRCIRDVIEEINSTMFLPAIQREYVWTTPMVEKLFDSIMGDFPISSFLFWKIEEKKKREWVSYKFINDFDAARPHNQEANLSGVNKDIHLVLDGQQRLTSLYIGLKGSFSFFHYRHQTTKLYLNLFKKPTLNDEEPEEPAYQFKFHERRPETNDTDFWYPVGNILDDDDAEGAKERIEKELSESNEGNRRNALRLIGTFHSRIHTLRLINYYEEKSQDYDKAVEVFIRANTGGKKLDYSDILLSTATARWKNLNAREELNAFTDSINDIGSGFSFSKDFVLKGALFLTEGLPIQYKVRNFTQSNLEKIETNWENIKSHIEQTVSLVSKFGFHSRNVVSAGALLPIAYYLEKIGSKKYHLLTDKTAVSNQNIIQSWLIIALLKNAFGGSSDTKLKRAQNAIKTVSDDTNFPYAEINKSLGIENGFSEAEMEHLMYTSHSTKYSFLILSLLYPNRDWGDAQYHEDHIFPKSEFNIKKLRNRGYDDARIEKYQNYHNTILNLELLTNVENQSKYSTPFDSWIKSRDENFKMRHMIPEMNSYSFDNFIEVIEERRNLIFSKIKAIPTFLESEKTAQT